MFSLNYLMQARQAMVFLRRNVSKDRKWRRWNIYFADCHYEQLGGIKVGESLKLLKTGVLSATKQSDSIFAEELKEN